MRRSFTKVLSFLMALMMIVGSFSAIAVSAADCDHANKTSGEIVRQQELTCTKDGYVIRECDLCGVQYYASYAKATGKHTPVAVGDTAATCTAPAKKGGTKCSVCNTTITEGTNIPGSKPLGHDWQEVVKSDATDCTVGTYKFFECSRCDKTPEKADTDEKNATTKYNAWYGEVTVTAAQPSHNYAKVEVVKAPTLCVDGQAKYSCTNAGCKATKTAVIEAVHIKVDIADAGWSCGDYKADAEKCTECGKVFGDTNTDKKHTWVTITALSDANVTAALKTQLINAGYDNDTKLAKTASCQEKGFKIEVCKICHNAWQKTETTGDHTLALTTSTSSTDDTYCSTAVVQTYKCTTKNCTHVVSETVVTPAVKHDYATKYETDADSNFDETADDVKALACETTYYSKEICKSCNHEKTNSEKTLITATHTWGDWSALQGTTCETGFYKTRTCTNTNCSMKNAPTVKCDGTDNDPRIQVIAVKGTHNMSDNTDQKLVEGDCLTKSYYATYCKNANCTHTVKVPDSDTAVVPTKHASAALLANVEGATMNSEDWAVGKAQSTYKITGILAKTVSTCTAEGSLKYICECGVECTATIKKINHKPSTQGAVLAGKYDVSKKDATCAATGLEAGYACTECYKTVNADGSKVVDRVVIKKTTAHTGTQITLKKVDPTCSSKGYTLMKCPTCTVEYRTSETAVRSHNYVDVTAKAPTCLVAGNYAHKACEYEDCKAVQPNTMVVCNSCNATTKVCANADSATAAKHTALLVAGNVVRSATGHHIVSSKLEGSSGAVAGYVHYNETCGPKADHEVATCKDFGCKNCGKGITAFTYCDNANCDVDLKTDGNQQYIMNKREIAPHGDAHYVEYKEKAATCTTNGFGLVADKAKTDLHKVGEKYYYCSECDVDVLVEVKKAGHKWNATPVEYNKPGTEGYNCTLPTLTYKVCTVCGEHDNTSYAEGRTEHNWSAVQHEVKLNDAGDLMIDTGSKNLGGPVCTTSAFKYTECTACSQVKKENVVPASGKHFYYLGDGTTKVDVSLTCAGIKDHLGQVTVCCGKTIVNKDTATTGVGAVAPATELGYSHNYVKDEVVATCTTAGSYIEICSTCGDVKAFTETKALNPNHDPDKCTPKVTAFMSEKAATATEDGYKEFRCPDCNEIVKFIIEASGAQITTTVSDKTNAFNGGKVTLDVSITADSFKFYTLTYKLPCSADLKLAGYKSSLAADGYMVSVFANEQTNANGKYISVVVAIADAKTGKATNFALAGNKVSIVTLEFDILETATAASFGTAEVTEVYKLKDDGKPEKITKYTVDGDYANFASTYAGDLDGTAGLTANDSFVIRTAILNNTFNSASDFNKDGTVDMLDYAAFMKFLGSPMKYYDRLVLQSVDLAQLVVESGLVVEDIDKNGLTADQSDINLVVVELTRLLKTPAYNASVDMATMITAAIAAAKA